MTVLVGEIGWAQCRRSAALITYLIVGCGCEFSNVTADVPFVAGEMSLRRVEWLMNPVDECQGLKEGDQEDISLLRWGIEVAGWMGRGRCRKVGDSKRKVPWVLSLESFKGVGVLWSGF